MGYKTLYFKYLWRHSCLSSRIHHGGSCTKPSNCSDKINMPKSTTGRTSLMWPNPQETADFVTFAEEIINGKLHFLLSAAFYMYYKNIYSEKFHENLRVSPSKNFKTCFENVFKTSWKMRNCYDLEKHFSN